VRTLLVSVHDVTPAHEPSIRKALRLLDESGVREVALFVVPDWHGEWPLPKFGEFAEFLRERSARGAEIALHGLRHDEAGSKRTWLQHLRALGRTAREAEFLSLAPLRARERIRAGLDLLGEAGLVPSGFVPPAWLAAPGLIPVLRDYGFRFTEDAWRVTDVPAGRSRRAPCVHWSTRRAHRAAAGVAIAAVRLPLERPRKLLRLAIHPGDVEHPWVARSLRQSLDRLLAQRTPLSYAAALASRSESGRIP
jgi:predicted deacetylase